MSEATDAARGGGGTSPLLLAAPMSIEAALIASATRTLGGTFSLGRHPLRERPPAREAGGQADVAVVRKTGMGPGRSKAAVAALAGAPASAMLVLGFCGGLDAGSVPGEVIVAEHVYSADDEGHPEQRVRCDLSVPLLQRLAGRGMKVRTGDVVCVARLALGERRAQLHSRGAIAVDMESVWLAAGASGRPFGVVRVVLDSPEHELLRIGAVAGALRAARALRRVAGALHGWAPAV